MEHWEFKPFSQIKCCSSTGEMIFSNSDTHLRDAVVPLRDLQLSHSFVSFLGELQAEPHLRMEIKTPVPEAVLLFMACWSGTGEDNFSLIDGVS